MEKKYIYLVETNKMCGVFSGISKEKENVTIHFLWQKISQGFQKHIIVSYQNSADKIIVIIKEYVGKNEENK